MYVYHATSPQRIEAAKLRPRWRSVATRLGMMLLIAVSCRANIVQAHPISLTDALVLVSPKVANVQITIFLEDLYLFHGLRPNDRDLLELKVLREGAELHRKFLMDRFIIRDAEGEPIRMIVQRPAVIVFKPRLKRRRARGPIMDRGTCDPR